MSRQFGSLILGLFIVIGMVSTVHGSMVPESYLTLGSFLEDDSSAGDSATTEASPPIPDVGVGEAPSLNYSDESNSTSNSSSGNSYLGGSYGNYFQTAYSQGYRTGKRLLRKGCCSHCHCFGCSCYTWQAYVGALSWQRTSPGGGVTVREYSGSQATLLDSNDYDFGWNNGWQVGLARRLSCVWAAEARFYRVDSFDAIYNTSSDNGAVVPYVVPVVTEFGVCDIESAYSSELTNLELNLRRHVSQRIDLVAGFRYIQLNDRYRMRFNGENDELHSIHSFNNMYGFHVGPDVCLVSRGPFCVEWGTRLGVYGNRIDNGISAVQDSVVIAGSKAAQHHTAFSADMDLTGTYQYNDCLAFRFGYQVLWLEGVAEATAQIGSLAPFTTIDSGVDTDGSPFYHGAFVDIVLSW